MLNAGNTFGTNNCTRIIVAETQDITPIVDGYEIAEIAQEAQGNHTG